MSKNKKLSHYDLNPIFSGISVNRDGEYIAITQDGQIFWIHPNAKGERVWTRVADYSADQTEEP